MATDHLKMRKDSCASRHPMVFPSLRELRRETGILRCEA
jgi:hypothetical protein